ncbi:hypothetical protein F886_01381 [Acinetobacter sp. NIPH 542]|uniref:ATP-binding protein n=1 Tax=Acinetobacter sp. NIPH 542 TaxID=1217688 RepID=UPI0002D023BE|nr:ATP-binding protein [Acinetobacter sp. NIPH 542]ENX45943.1 hypothetical protein F886_01381 [Acinetobacter sp. NIPH 542]
MAKIRTKARTLDMLGRQQIAGIPTALSELFKNAHDAYADNVEVDYIRKRNLLILRDNGLGMTLNEFEERWLTIGTDSKFEDEDALAQPVVDNEKNKRQVMGEKGIGRLAIAAIGPQVLVMTRARRGNELGELVVAFVNWTLFSLPSLDLSDIEIPIITKESGKIINLIEVENLKEQAKNNIKSLSNKISINKINNICEQIDSFNYDPEYWKDQLEKLDDNLNLTEERGYLSLDGEGYGTHFIISPIDEVLDTEIDVNSEEEVSKLKKVLLGFTNTIKDDRDLPIKARFRDHNYQGQCIDHLDEDNFFTREDFNLADHHFVGKFDEYGQFHGSINIFGNLSENITIPWMNGGNVPTNCGAFEIHLASVQGRAKESKLAPELHNELSNKTNKIGGLYIYRDGIRVLPYGGPEFDFLGIEYRRTKRAADYYFSYRNMIGYIDVTKRENSNLQEKAGREGFIENKAYKQFKSILENFFIFIASNYFTERGEMSDLFMEHRNRNKEINEALEKRQKLKSAKRKRLQENLKKFFEKFDEGMWDVEISNLRDEISDRINLFNLNEADYDDFIFSLEEKYKRKLYEIREEIKINIPTGVGFGKELTRQIDYQKLCSREVEQSLNTLQDWFNSRLVYLEDLYGNRKNLKRRLVDSFIAQEELHKKKINEIYRQTEESIKSLTSWATDEIKKSRTHSYETLIQVKEEFASTNLSEKNTQEIYDLKKTLETKLDRLTEEVIEKIDRLNSQINVTKEGSQENQVSSAQLTAVLEAENEHLKEQHEENIEMIQLGMALGVIHHEFNNNIIFVRRGITEFKPWAEKNKNLYSIYEKIRVGFDHLDGYLRIFTPLSRRLSRKQVEITGKSLSTFVKEVFYERCEKENIILEITENFINYKTFGYTSTIYPAFVNIIDNALYWVLKSSGEKKVTLDAQDNSFIIKDTGPGIQTIDIENIFEFGFSRRIGGRGMGLYVTKQTLEKDNFRITLDPYDPSSGAVFRIFKDMEEDI